MQVDYSIVGVKFRKGSVMLRRLKVFGLGLWSRLSIPNFTVLISLGLESCGRLLVLIFVLSSLQDCDELKIILG